MFEYLTSTCIKYERFNMFNGIEWGSAVWAVDVGGVGVCLRVVTLGVWGYVYV